MVKVLVLQHAQQHLVSISHTYYTIFGNIGLNPTMIDSRTQTPRSKPYSSTLVAHTAGSNSNKSRSIMATTLYKRIDNGGVRSNSAKVPKVAQDEHNSSSNDTPLQDSEGQGAKNCLHVVQKAASLTSMFTAPLVAIHLNYQNFNNSCLDNPKPEQHHHGNQFVATVLHLLPGIPSSVLQQGHHPGPVNRAVILISQLAWHQVTPVNIEFKIAGSEYFSTCLHASTNWLDDSHNSFHCWHHRLHALDDHDGSELLVGHPLLAHGCTTCHVQHVKNISKIHKMCGYLANNLENDLNLFMQHYTDAVYPGQDIQAENWSPLHRQGKQHSCCSQPEHKIHLHYLLCYELVHTKSLRLDGTNPAGRVHCDRCSVPIYWSGIFHTFPAPA